MSDPPSDTRGEPAGVCATLADDQQRALDALCRVHTEALRRYARRIVGSRETAEDVVQEVFFRVWRLRDRLAFGVGIRSYLYIATRARALNALQRGEREEQHRQRGPRAGVAGDEPALAPEGEAVVEGEEIVRAIERVLAAMPPRQREVARLRLRMQLTTPEIARRLGLSPRTVEFYVGRATRMLRDRLPALLGNGEGSSGR